LKFGHATWGVTCIGLAEKKIMIDAGGGGGGGGAVLGPVADFEQAASRTTRARRRQVMGSPQRKSRARAG
jgi:hypothetical protein